MTHESTIATEKVVQNVRRSLRIRAARTQAIRGVKLQTTPTVDTGKYFIALKEMKIESVV